MTTTIPVKTAHHRMAVMTFLRPILLLFAGLFIDELIVKRVAQ
jgi:hypothetical protein